MKKVDKGITPVVATVLLISISVAATAAAYQFVIGSQKDLRQGFEDQLQREERKQQTDFNVEHVYNSTGNSTILNVRNTGSVSLAVQEENGEKVWSLYVNGRPVGRNGKGWQFHNTGKEVLDPGEVLAVDSTEPYPAKGGKKTFKLVGQYGISDSHVCVNTGQPSC